MKRNLCLIALAVIAAVVVGSCSMKFELTYSSVVMTLDRSNYIIPYEGGTFDFYYRVTGQRETASTHVSSTEPWIHDFDVSVADTLKFVVDFHEERENRSASVTIAYIEDGDTLTSRVLTVIQEWNSYYELELEYAEGYYYGITNAYSSEGNLQSCFYLSDKEIADDGSFEKGGSYYYIDLWTSETPDGVNFVNLPAGQYGFGQVGETNVFSDESKYYYVSEDDEEDDIERELVGGNIVVERDGGITNITATLEDSEGGTHHLTYSGEFLLENSSLLSSLEDDFALGDFSSVACTAIYYGDYYTTGTANWVLNIYPETGTGFTIDYCGDPSFTYASASIPVGTFDAAADGGAMDTFLSGSIYTNYLSGTWLVTLDEDGALTEPYAPIVGGTIEISVSDGTYTVTVDALDDRDNAVTGSWTGVPTYLDYTTQPQSIGRGNSKLSLSLPY